ncbi:MAG: hypothetical protein CMO80_23090 [Verrucomicrobiales bacterium]|nr:hypothetical protein [Verrucomicrobiales bacterium]
MTLLAEGEDSDVPGFSSSLRFNAMLGQQYHIAVAGLAGLSGDITLSIDGGTPTPLQLDELRFVPGTHLKFRLASARDRIAIIESSSILVHWTALTTNVILPNSTEITLDRYAADQKRFYRVVVP